MSDYVIPPDIEKRLDERAKAVWAVFQTDGGQRALDVLRDMFDADDLRGQTTEDTYYRLGQRDVIIYIDQLIRRVNGE